MQRIPSHQSRFVTGVLRLLIAIKRAYDLVCQCSSVEVPVSRRYLGYARPFAYLVLTRLFVYVAVSPFHASLWRVALPSSPDRLALIVDTPASTKVACDLEPIDAALVPLWYALP